MGFGPSAGWAQGLTDVVATDAGLPQSQRVVPDFVTPEGLLFGVLLLMIFGLLSMWMMMQ